MSQRTILIAALALLVLLAGVLILVVRERPSASGEATSSPPSARVTEKAPPAPPSAPEPVDLGSVLDLQSLSDCSPGPNLASIFEQMVRIDPRTFESRRGGPIGVPGYDRPITPTFERRREVAPNIDMREVTADLDLPGRWHGLLVTGLRRYFHEESDVAAFAILFAEPPGRVHETLVRQGFRLPPAGELRVLDENEGSSTMIGVEPVDGGAALTCATG